MQIATEYPILFLSDSKWTPTPEVEDPLELTSDCVCLPVLAYVDGASTVTVTDDQSPVEGHRMFAGVIQASSGVLTVSDSYNFCYLNVPVSPGPVSLEIWVDELVNPEWVRIRLGAILSY